MSDNNKEAVGDAKNPKLKKKKSPRNAKKKSNIEVKAAPRE